MKKEILTSTIIGLSFVGIGMLALFYPFFFGVLFSFLILESLYTTFNILAYFLLSILNKDMLEKAKEIVRKRDDKSGFYFLSIYVVWASIIGSAGYILLTYILFCIYSIRIVQMYNIHYGEK